MATASAPSLRLIVIVVNTPPIDDVASRLLSTYPTPPLPLYPATAKRLPQLRFKSLTCHYYETHRPTTITADIDIVCELFFAPFALAP